MQSKADARLLSITAFLLPILCLLRPKNMGWLVLGTALLYPATWVIYEVVKLSIYGFSGGTGYIPIEFLFFCTLLSGIIFYTIYVCFSPLSTIHAGKEEFHKWLRLTGLIIGILELPLFFHEIYEIAKQFLGY